MTPLLVAVRFLTRLPLGSPRHSVRPGDAAWCFPLVGVFIGACVGGAFWLAQAAGLSSALAGFVGVAAGMLLTGALHEDGLADMADGFGAPPDRALAAMRDSNLGAWGVLALVVTVPVRAFALAAAGPLSAIAAHALSRAAMTAPMHWMRPARERWACRPRRAGLGLACLGDRRRRGSGVRLAGLAGRGRCGVCGRLARATAVRGLHRRCPGRGAAGERDCGPVGLGRGMKGSTRFVWVRHAPVTGHRGRVYGASDVSADVSDCATFGGLAALLPRGRLRSPAG